MWQVIIAVLFLGVSLASGKGTVVHNTRGGVIEGSVIDSRLGKQIASFRGIQYALAPRFQAPVPILSWNGTYNATVDGPVCPQPTEEPMAEECLFLNVYTTKLQYNASRPVIVYFHAGGYYSGTGASSFTGPDYLLDQDIVLVTVNYRLASLGFMSTGDKESPGNYGLKDQVAALQWVQANIIDYGGDPNNVVIMGYSAGGASITLHLVSPMSKGLFHKAIAMSGSNLGNWPVPNHQLDLAEKQARILNCPTDNSSVIVACLRTKSYEELGNSLGDFDEFGSDPILLWYPVIEPDVGQTRFLSENPITLAERNEFMHVPLLTGVTQEEFAMQAFMVFEEESRVKEFNENFDKIAPIAFLYERDTEFSVNVSHALKKFYFNDQPIDNSTFTNLTHAYSDGIIGFAVDKAAKIIANLSTEPVFYYKFNYQGRWSHFYLPGTNDTVPYGAVHHDDLIYLFYIERLFPRFEADSPKEIEMVQKLTTLWANFAATGKPIPEPNDYLDNVTWEPFTSESRTYMELNAKLEVKSDLHKERYDAWAKLFTL